MNVVNKKQDAGQEANIVKRVLDSLEALCIQKSLEPLKKMFWTDLGYKRVDQPLAFRNWQDAHTIEQYLYPDNPLLLFATSGQGDFDIIYIRLSSLELPLTYECPIIHNLLQNHFDALFVFSNASLDKWHFVNVKPDDKRAKRRIFRRFTIGQEEQLRIASERLALLSIADLQYISALELQKRHNEAFDVTAVTKAFFDAYQRQFRALQKDLYIQVGDMNWAHDYAHLFLNRCMFLYFIQRKGWLGDNKKILHTLWDTYNKEILFQEKQVFFDDWLQVLFLKAFNQAFDESNKKYSYLPSSVKTTLAKAPFLGGLFAPGSLDEQEGFSISDVRFGEIFEFFEGYNFTVVEDSPLDQEVAVDPEMIGRVYESLVNVSSELDERGDAGIFYTPRTEIDLMCRLSIVDYLANHLPHVDKNLFYRLVFALEPHEKSDVDEEIESQGYWDIINTHISVVTILDPACGSGAFLVGMLKVLDDLQARANRYLQGNSGDDYDRRKRIIGQSLYGVDIMEWATRVAELRLWLILTVEPDIPLHQLHSRRDPILPHFTFNIRSGDSLVQQMGDNTHKAFDIVVGNPPYVRQENISNPLLPRKKVDSENKRAYKKKLAHSIYQAFPDFFQYNSETQKAGHELDAKSDLYVYFYLHSLHLLNPNGTLCFITSNSWLDVGYGTILQEFLLQHCKMKMLIDNASKRSFATADVNTIITLFSAPISRDSIGQESITCFVRFTVDFEQVLSPDVFREIENTQEPTSTERYRIYPISQRALLREGSTMQKVKLLSSIKEKRQTKTMQHLPSEISSYTGNKLGGKFLRAPKIYWTLLEKGEGKLKRIGDITTIRYGIKTGANEFFYLNDKEIRRWQIEEEFLQPIIKSPTDCTNILVQPNVLKSKLFFCHKTEAELRGTAAGEYIRWGESQGFDKNASVSGRTRWWSVSFDAANSIFVKEAHNTSAVFYNPSNYPVDCRLYYADLPITTLVYLNSAVGALLFEIYNRAGLGGGARSMMVSDYTQIPALCNIVEKEREAEQVFQQVYGLAARKLVASEGKRLPTIDMFDNPWRVVDDFIFDILHLTHIERDAVYEEVVNLVEGRIKKAGSLYQTVLHR